MSIFFPLTEEARKFKARPIPRCISDNRHPALLTEESEAKAGATDEDNESSHPRRGGTNTKHSLHVKRAKSFGTVEGSMLSRQREWEQAREQKLLEARAAKEDCALAVRSVTGWYLCVECSLT